MHNDTTLARLDEFRTEYPMKFASEEEVFSHIHPGDRIFIGTGCGEPQYLVRALVSFVEAHPKAFFDAEVMHVWTLDLAPYTEEKFKSNFRHNSFFIGRQTRGAVNQGAADYTPVFLSHVPRLFYDGRVPIDVALVQMSPPDEHGYMSLGISVDIVKAAVESATLVIAQTNAHMPRVLGDTFFHIRDIDYIIPYDEPLLTYGNEVSSDTANRIGKYVARIIQDGDTIQVGYGSIPNAIMANLSDRRDLGVHTELLSDGLVDLIRKGVITNAKKTVNRGKTVAAFCMGSASTYEFIDNNPGIEFRPVDYTNNPLTIARQVNMTAINSVLEMDLTGEATAESIGKTFYSGIGGQADFMRGAIMAPGGKTIIAMQSTAENESVSRIVPFLAEGAGATLNRGDVHYVVTEFGIAYLHGKNVRERAMDLISIAHPKFRPWLIDEAKKLRLIYADQAFIPGEPGLYPEHLERERTTSSGMHVLLRPVKISDEPLLKDFFYDLSDKSIYRRFMSLRKHMPHERLQEFVVIDYTKEIVILASVHDEGGREEVVGIGQYSIVEGTHSADVAFVISDSYQNRGIGFELLKYLAYLAKGKGILAFTADVLTENVPMLRVFEKLSPDIHRRIEGGAVELHIPLSSSSDYSG
ncbi:MAG TPA: GNAT family N-acetyltransferase [Candidatus Hydrogenedentes bacterium]|nr:GNAT family N-acetyltransferase [Candidatus Hydrogenedentota bacterium]HPG65855.1 GNAT family N-acetyltransferase [Candidatus Hydrogenedentota bacterium]